MASQWKFLTGFMLPRRKQGENGGSIDTERPIDADRLSETYRNLLKAQSMAHTTLMKPSTFIARSRDEGWAAPVWSRGKKLQISSQSMF